MNYPPTFDKYGKITRFVITDRVIEGKAHRDTLELTIEDFDQYGEQFLTFASDYADALPHFKYITHISYDSSTREFVLKARTHDLPF